MRRVSIINQKGGVGKTTTAANLGAALANSGWRVLLIDLDPQSHLTMHYVVDLDEDRPTIYDVMTSSCTIDEAALAVRENIRLVPSDVDLAGAETELAQASGRQIILRDAVEPIAADYDIMLIDCPPSVGLLTVNALAATYEMLIPLQPHFLPLQGLAKLHETVTLVHRHINSRLRIAGIVICIHDAGTRLAGEVIEDLEQFLQAFRAVGAAWSDARLFNTRIRRNVKLAESPSHGKTIFDYAPTSHGAQDYANLAAEIFGTEQVEAEDAPTAGEVSPAETERQPPVQRAAVVASAESTESAVDGSGLRTVDQPAQLDPPPAVFDQDVSAASVSSAVDDAAESLPPDDVARAL